MASSPASQVALPPIPHLRSVANLEEWKDILLNTLACHDLEAYIRESLTEPKEPVARKVWKKDRATVTLLIKGSLSKVRSVLLNGGWDPDEKDPKKHYDFIVREIVKMSEPSIGDLVYEFCHIERDDFDSLAAYQGRVQYLRRRLPELDCEFGDTVQLWIAVNGLKDKYGRWFASLAKDMAENKLTWDGLMKEMSVRAIKEDYNWQSVSNPASPDNH